MAGNIRFDCVDITGGFWEKIQRRNREVTIPNVYDRFAETGRIKAFDFDWKEGMPDMPHIFWDSDIAKWMESAAYSLRKHPDAALEAKVEALIDRIEQHQGEDGYFNIHFQVVEPDKRWYNRNWHELYCAGHLMEAAVAWADTTGRDRFLRCMCRYADYIEKVFVKENSAAFTAPGHEEIELALIKLWAKTGEERYLKLSQFFLEQRGHAGAKELAQNWGLTGSKNIQDHKPVREQDEAVGHAVRAGYLYAAMADMARITGDEGLTSACGKLWKSITTRRMYITGGVGQTNHGEAFTIDYDLPSRLAYAESCAQIALAFFAERMNALSPKGEYGDIVERILYNGFLSTTDLKGDHFFYENPLEIDTAADRALKATGNPMRVPPSQRVKVFSCSCCPPNITRFTAELGDFLYTADGDTVYVNQYMDNRATFDGVTLTQETNYPLDGRIDLHAEGLEGKMLALRKPAWCASFTLEAGGQPFTAQERDGWLLIPGAETLDVTLTLEMPLTLVNANPNVHEADGRVAMTRGPVVYCLEGVDNGENLRDIAVIPGAPASLVYDTQIGMYTIETEGTRTAWKDPESLYAPYTGERVRVPLRFIPYYAFANRGESDMIVWVDVQK